MTHPAVIQTQALILAGEIAEAESQLVAIAETQGDQALVSVLDELAPKDLLAIMREFDSSKESVINLVVSPEQFVDAILLERKYGEPLEKYVPRLRNTMNAVMHRGAGACVEILECLTERDEGIRLLADYFTDYYDLLQNFAFHGRFEDDFDLEKAMAPKRTHSFDAEEQFDEMEQGLEAGDSMELARPSMSRSEVADGDWMETAWVLRHEFQDSFELLIIEVQDRMRREMEAAHVPPPVETGEPGVPKIQEDEEESAI
ncbi:hypothetical protein GPA27_12785 [Aromatoleum toluolicum]|uniref:Uncharacterized protein n=1 Tax=Aromatoleum toluolicum TaxID=90060 RepID=A0ABX1NGE4_9RHOO|nr:hypothetical protein [Aromatoleum toluolicum]NMF98260.1 hypothetical protein [Aromatoleum toluolicum]